MTDIFKTLADVEARVKSDPTGNGRGLLEIELNMGVYDEKSASLVRAWIGEYEGRKMSQKAIDDEREERDHKKRTLAAAETQASAALMSVRISRWAIAISVVSLVIAAVALYRS